MSKAGSKEDRSQNSVNLEEGWLGELVRRVGEGGSVELVNGIGSEGRLRGLVMRVGQRLGGGVGRFVWRVG